MTAPGVWEEPLRDALRLAAQAPSWGDVPVGAVVVGPDGAVLGRGVKCGHSTEAAAKAEQLLEFKGALLACSPTSARMS